MQEHVKIVGWLHLVLGGLGLLAGLFFGTMIFGGGLLSGEAEGMLAGSLIAAILGGFIVLFSVPGIFVGLGLLQRKSWARIGGIVLGVLNLVNFPFGTILGVYTLWVLLNDRTVELFRRPVAY